MAVDIQKRKRERKRRRRRRGATKRASLLHRHHHHRPIPMTSKTTLPVRHERRLWTFQRLERCSQDSKMRFRTRPKRGGRVKVFARSTIHGRINLSHEILHFVSEGIFCFDHRLHKHLRFVVFERLIDDGRVRRVI